MNSIINFFTEPNWFATIIVYFFIIYISYRIVKKLFSKFSWFKKKLEIFKYLVYCILLFELGLRVTGLNQTYLEKKSGKYQSMYKFRPEKIIHKCTPSDSLLIESNEEFKFLFKTNSWGYSDREWDDLQEKNLKILALGDSFTEGVGTQQDSSWVDQISKKYANRNIKWYNGGISASDPFSNLYNLQNELFKINPDIIVQIFSNQDFEEDILLRGGNERFEDGRLEYDHAPAFEYVYAYSHIVRLFQNYFTNKVYFIDLEHLKKNQSDYHYDQLIQLYNDWAEKKRKQVILVYYNTNSYYYKSGETSKFDIAPIVISDYLTVESITSCYQEAIHQDFNKFRKLWWEKDGHHNTEGYQLMSNCIYELIQPTVDSTYVVKFSD